MHTLNNCYDSHIHWQATGDIATRLNLGQVKSPEDLRQLKIESHHWQGEWLLGFGWDEHLWVEGQKPHRFQLDELWPHQPVCFSRADGHAFWVNSEALKRMGWSEGQELPQISGGEVILDADGQPRGVFLDRAKAPIEALLPEPSDQQICAYLLKGLQIFNRAGFTHLRDLGGEERHWQEACRLDQSGLLTAAIEQFFFVNNPADYNQALQLALRARQDQWQNLRVGGVKVYLDGALGSEGALLSTCYHGSDQGSHHHHHKSVTSHRGLSLMGDELLEEILRRCWEQQMPVAVHVIGDEACHRVVVKATELWERGLTGTLHLEHAQMLRPETLALMQGRTILCHMQPCHWLSDRVWLREKLGPELYSHVFPWRRLQEASIAFDFGSDSPIARPSVGDNFLALQASAKEGIAPLLGSPIPYHCHPDTHWAPTSFTQFDLDWQVQRVVFRGQDIPLQ